MKKRVNVFKRLMAMVLAVVLLSGLTGCLVPYDKPEFVTIEASQTAFLIPLVGDETNQAVFASEDLLESAKVATKEVQITHRWVKTGRMKTTGEYRPTVKLIIVERKPETREWTAEKDTGSTAINQAIYAESKESIGFSVGMNCTAQIDEVNATKFLYRYNNKTLSEIMDTEIRARVESDFVEQCAKFTLEDLLINKETIMDAVREDVASYFAERGITINNLGMKEGLTYEDDKIQQSINDKYSSEQLIVTQANENERSISEAKAQAESAKLKAQGEADALLVKAEAEAKANKLISESITQQLIDKTLADNWDGKLPTVQGSSGNILDLGNVLTQ